MQQSQALVHVNNIHLLSHFCPRADQPAKTPEAKKPGHKRHVERKTFLRLSITSQLPNDAAPNNSTDETFFQPTVQ